MKYLEKLHNSLTKKIIACPVCHKKIRIPIKVGRTLEINCPFCKSVFQISFRSSMHELFKWDKNATFISNVISILRRFKNIPSFMQIILYLGMIIIVLYFLNNLV